jgi:hypothetical protein
VTREVVGVFVDFRAPLHERKPDILLSDADTLNLNEHNWLTPENIIKIPRIFK